MQPEQKVNVLLVDDRLENLLALEAILDSLGQNLVKARSGAEALRCLLNQDFAVILLDVQMPGMDGFETARLIRERERSRHTPIIFMTAFSNSDTLVYKGYSLGAVDYLFKPIDQDILISKVMVFVELFKKSAEVKQQAAQLQKAHNELEIRVQERTAELTKINTTLQNEIARRNQIEVKLREAIKEAQDLYNNAPCGYHCLDQDGTFVAINDTALNFLGYTRDELIGKLKFSDLITIESSAAFHEAFSRLPEQSWIYDLEVQMVCKDATLMPVILKARAIKDAAGQYVASRSTIFDITERKQAEDQIKASLQEKEVLLKEIHHRVKNNLQIVSGLLYLQSRYIEDEPTLQVLQENRSRIQSMALIHEKLYGSKNFDKIDFKDYIYSLLQNLVLSYAVNTDFIALKISIEPVILDIDTAIHCGLIINELVLNTLKHAFLGRQSGEITVEFYKHEPNSFELIISDNGVGFPEELDFQNQKSLGLRLVHSLVTKQLEGTIKLDRSQGAKFKMCWKI